MSKIYIKNQNKALDYSPSKNLLEILLENDIFIDNPCNGKGSCGKCKVKLSGESLPEMSETEMKLLKEEEIKEGTRIACLVLPEGDIEVEVLQKERKHRILSTGYVPEFKYGPSIKKIAFKIDKPTLENQISLEDSIIGALGVEEVELHEIEEVKGIDGTATAIFNGDHLLGIEKGDTTESLYGVAIDVGTTTAVATLVDMKTGKEVATASMINPQRKFGLDVLTRITYALENPKDSRAKLQYEIVSAINEMVKELCGESGVDQESIYEIAIAANCTMMHFLLGVDATSIGKSPYAPLFVKSKNIRASDIGIVANSRARLYCLPSVSSYIGADIVAGAYVCELHKASGNTLFIDIGTNGEIVLSSDGKLMSCSCAAGPALEGMNISSGMRASEGAIEDVKIGENGIETEVIGSEEAAGLCGSGILAVVKELIRTGIVKKNGAFIKKEKLDESDYRYDMIHLNGTKREFVLKEGPKRILVTQSDVRQVQLAKGAILSGFYALLNKAGIDMGSLDRVMIAGQFGAHLPEESLVGTGILPEEVKDKIYYVGNSSKTGAYISLMSAEARKEIEAIAGKMEYMELGASEGYERLFADCLLF